MKTENKVGIIENSPRTAVKDYPGVFKVWVYDVASSKQWYPCSSIAYVTEGQPGYRNTPENWE